MITFLEWLDDLETKQKKSRFEKFLKESKWDFLTYLWIVVFLLTLLLFGRITE